MSRLIAFFLLCLMIVGAYLRLQGTELYHLNADEAGHLQMARTFSVEKLLQFSHYETHPPLGNLLRHLWLKLEDSPSFARSLALLFGLVLIPLYYLLGARLGGRVAGIGAAILITFSSEAITQSFLVRNYTILAFFLSCSVLCYLSWHKKQNMPSLLWYSFWGVLANLTHFSGIFLIFSIAAYEAIHLLRHRKLHSLLQWCVANVVLGAFFLLQVFFWRDHANSQHLGFLTPLKDSIADALWYPAITFSRLLPGSEAPVYLLALFCIVPFALYAIWLGRRCAHPLAEITILAIMLGVLLVASGSYPGIAGRHAMWLLPLLIPSVATLAAQGYRKIERHVMRISGFRQSSVATTASLLTILILFCFTQRDSTEYYLKNSLWQQFTPYLTSLDKNHVLISTKGEIMLLDPPGINPYAIIDAASHAEVNHITTETAFYNSRIVFNTHEWFFDTQELLAATLEDAEKLGKLKPEDTLVFIVSTAPLYELMHCTQLKKHIHKFSEHNTSSPLPLNMAYRTYVATLEVQWADFKLNMQECFQH